MGTRKGPTQVCDEDHARVGTGDLGECVSIEMVIQIFLSASCLSYARGYRQTLIPPLGCEVVCTQPNHYSERLQQFEVQVDSSVVTLLIWIQLQPRPGAFSGFSGDRADISWTACKEDTHEIRQASHSANCWS